MRKAWNRQEENSNFIITAETTPENPSPVSKNTYDLTYHAKQWGKGLLVFGAGLLGYVGFSAFFGSRQEESTQEAERLVDGNLVFSEENLLNVQTTISGISPSLDHQSSKEFLPTSFSTPRSLLSLQEKEAGYSDIDLRYRQINSAKTDNTGRPLQSTRRASLEDYEWRNEFQVNTYTAGSQRDPSVSSLLDGSFVVVWSGSGSGDGSGVYGHRYSSAGLPVGSEFKVNTYTSNTQISPAITFLTGGGFVVVWESDVQDGESYGVYGQRYNNIGQSVGGEFQVNTYTTGIQRVAAVAPLSNGGFVVVWEDSGIPFDGQDGSRRGVFGQRYDATGQQAGVEFQVNSYTILDQYNSDVTYLQDGGFMVVWTSWAQDGDNTGIYGQRYNATGLPEGPEFQVNNYTTSSQGHPAVTSLIDGSLVVVWNSFGQDGDSYGVYGQRYDNASQPVGGEFQVNTYTTLDQQYPSVTSLSDGGFVVVWESDGQDGDNEGVYGRRYNATDQMMGAEFRVNTYTASRQSFPVVTGLTGGGFVVAWNSKGQDGSSAFFGVYGRIFSHKNKPPVLLNNKLTVEQGERVSLTSALLSAMDIDNNNFTLNFIVNNVSHGYFETTSNTGVEIVSFIQQAVTNGTIRFVHNGGTVKPYYEIKVSDGLLETAFVPATVTFSLRANNLLTTLLITGGVVGGICLCLTASAIVLILPAGIWMTKQKQNKLIKNTVEDISEQETELKEISDVTEKQVGSAHKNPTVTSTQKGFFQPPKATPQGVIELLQTNKQNSSAKENNKEQTETSDIIELLKMQSKSALVIKTVEASTSEDESEEVELIFVTKEEVTLKSCDNLVERKSALLAWGEKYSASNDTLLVYQQDTTEWFICGKNSEENVTNETISSASILGKMLTSKNWEEIAKINSEKLQDTALDYLGYEDENTEEDSSAEESRPRMGF